jgi:hypothetical protein
LSGFLYRRGRFDAASVKFLTLPAVKVREPGCRTDGLNENIRSRMTNTDLEKIRNALAGIEMVLAQCKGGRADDDALLEFRRLCWAALLLVDDAECQEQIDLLVQHSKALYSDGGHDGVEAVRGRIRTALGALRARLHTLEGGYGKRWRDLRAA